MTLLEVTAGSVSGGQNPSLGFHVANDSGRKAQRALSGLRHSTESMLGNTAQLPVQ